MPRALLAAALCTLAAVAPATVVAAAAGAAAAEAKVAPGRKPTLAVLYFDYEGKNEEMAVLRKGLAQMLITDFGPNPAFTVVERARLQDILDELKLGQSPKFDQATASKIGKLLGARYLVMGRYFELMGTLRIDARVVETETGSLVKGAGSHGKPDDFLELEQKIARELNDALSTALPSETAPTKAGEAAPKSPRKLPAKSAVRYSKALDALDRKDSETAKKELHALVKEQPDFLLASAELDKLLR
ncbi:MAG: hypothetical protein HY901_07000 [Deltaproteobacteria bacterium]|nr:hypothetical protein [Deltaproteobacteria bacterium]